MPSWTTGTYRGTYQISNAYNVGDIARDTDFHIANAQSMGGGTDAAPWDKLTTNMDYLGSPATGDTFRNGEVIFQTGHYHMRIGGTGTSLPDTAPAEWVVLSAGAESDAACQVKQYPVQVNNSNRLATVTAGTSVEQTDTAVWSITFTPQGVGSRVSIIMSMNVRSEDDGSTEEEVRYTYSLFDDTDSFNRISGNKYGSLKVGDAAGVEIWDHQLAEHWSHQPNSTDPVTYAFRLQRLNSAGTNTPSAEVTFASWSATVLDWGDPNQSCNTVFQSIPIWRSGVELFPDPVRLNITGPTGQVTGSGQLPNLDFSPFNGLSQAVSTTGDRWLFYDDTTSDPAWTTDASLFARIQALIPSAGDDAYAWATEGNDAVLVPEAKIPDLPLSKLIGLNPEVHSIINLRITDTALGSVGTESNTNAATRRVVAAAIGASGTTLTQEQVIDFVAMELIGGTNISVDYQDSINQLRINTASTSTTPIAMSVPADAEHILPYIWRPVDVQAAGAWGARRQNLTVPLDGTTGQVLTKATDFSGDHAWQDATGGTGGSSTFVGLTDTPAAITPTLCVAGNSAGTGLEWVACGMGGGTNDYVDTASLALAGQDLTLTLGRTGALADLEPTVTLPANIASAALSLIGEDLTLTVGRSAGNDFRSTVTLPAGGGGPASSTYSTLTSRDYNFTAASSFIAVLDALGAPVTLPTVFEWVHFRAGSAIASPGGARGTPNEWHKMSKADWDGLTATTVGTAPSTATAKGYRDFWITTAGSPSARDFSVGKTATDAMVITTDNAAEDFRPFTVVLEVAGTGGMGGGTDTNDYVDGFTTSLTGQDLVMTLGRTGSLPDLTQTVTLPAGGGGFSMEQIQDGMSQFLNFSGGITDTYNDVSNVYNISTVVVEDFADAGSATKIVAGDIADETITKDQIASGTIRGEQIAESSIHYSDLLAMNVYVPDENFLSFVGTGGTDVSLKYYNAADFRTAIGASGGGTVSTSAPVSGDGSTGDPVTVAARAITTDHLAAFSITSIKIDNGAVTEAKLAQAVIDQLGGGGGTTSREDVEDWVDDLLIAGTGITKSYNDLGNELTISSNFVDESVDTIALSQSAGILTATLGRRVGGDISTTFTLREHVQDYVNTLVVAGTNLTKDYDDTANTLTLNATAGGGGTSDGVVDLITISEASGILEIALGRTVGADVSDTYNIREHVDDYVNLLMTPGEGIAFDYNDGLNQLTGSMDIEGLTALPIIADADTLAIYDDDADEIRKVSAMELEREIRIHRGQWDPNTNYAQGWIAETGVSTSKEFWIAGVNLLIGAPEPTLADPHNWYLLAGRTHFRGPIDHTITHNVLDGTWFRVDDQVFMATESITGLTGDDALGGHAGVIELTMVPNPAAAPTEQLLTLGYDGVSYDVRGTGGGSSDTKVVTALPDAVDVADADKDKLWLVVPTADDGVVEVAHFAPADDPTIFKMTAQAFMQGPASYVGFDITDNGGHLEPATPISSASPSDTRSATTKSSSPKTTRRLSTTTTIRATASIYTSARRG